MHIHKNKNAPGDFGLCLWHVVQSSQSTHHKSPLHFTARPKANLSLNSIFRKCVQKGLYFVEESRRKQPSPSCCPRLCSLHFISVYQRCVSYCETGAYFPLKVVSWEIGRHGNNNRNHFAEWTLLIFTHLCCVLSSQFLQSYYFTIFN